MTGGMRLETQISKVSCQQELPVLELPEEIKDDVKLAADTVDAVEGIATSQLGIGPVPTLNEINSWTSVYGRLKDKACNYIHRNHFTDDNCIIVRVYQKVKWPISKYHMFMKQTVLSLKFSGTNGRGTITTPRWNTPSTHFASSCITWTGCKGS